MKFAVITDTHWGARNESPAFMDYFGRFYDEVFFPYLRANGITHVFHLGDLVDRRKYASYLTLSRMRRHFVKPIADGGMYCWVIPGNHDSFYKNSVRLNAPRELLSDVSKNFEVIDSPTDVDVAGVKFLALPWICSENEDVSMRAIASSGAQYCMAHLELVGFDMYRGQKAEHGMDPSVFDKFDAVYTGHYHHRSSKGNVHYLGSPYEIVWSDYDDPRGFHVFDTETRNMEFVRNPLTIHEKVFYDDGGEIDPAKLKDKIVKLVVSKKEDALKYDDFVTKLEKSAPVDVQVVDDHLNASNLDETVIADPAADTLGVLLGAIPENPGVDRKRLEGLLRELYVEASSSKV